MRNYGCPIRNRAIYKCTYMVQRRGPQVVLTWGLSAVDSAHCEFKDSMNWHINRCIMSWVGSRGAERGQFKVRCVKGRKVFLNGYIFEGRNSKEKIVGRCYKQNTRGYELYQYNFLTSGGSRICLWVCYSIICSPFNQKTNCYYLLLIGHCQLKFSALATDNLVYKADPIFYMIQRTKR